jgi:predicted transcriptional regulator
MATEPSPQPSYAPPSKPAMPASVAFEKHYCVSEVAELWGLSERTIRRIFTDEPGVIKWENGETRYKRGYTTLRIPESVVQRVHRKLRRAG